MQRLWPVHDEANYPDDDPTSGQECDPTLVDPNLGYNPDCSGVVVRSAACIGNYGPPGADLDSPSFGGSQEPSAVQEFADGVYSLLPLSASSSGTRTHST